MTRRYQVLPPTASVPAPDDPLEELARQGAQKMLERALAEEVDAYLGRRRYARGAQTGYRNGYLPERTIGTASAAITIRQPRVSEVPKDAEPFRSEIVRRWQRQSRTQQRLFVRLYLEGLSSGDFEPVFRALVGQTVALSPSSVLRLRQEWEQEYRAWQARAIAERYVYLFADGLYLKAGIEREHSVMLVVIGVNAEGRKDLLAMRLGYRESAESWEDVLRDLRDRGMSEAPLLGIGDGALGFWAALAEVYPTTKHQRCWNHRWLNVMDKLPKRLHAEAKRAITGMSEAPTREECTRQRIAYCTQLRAQGHPDAAACLERDWDDFTRFYEFPEEHWVHLRTSNPIESVFSGVRLRTDAAKRMQVRENAAYLVFKLVMRLSLTWRAINGRNQLDLLLAGDIFVNGKLQRSTQQATEGTAA